MPRYYEDKPEGGACAGVKEDLGSCLLQSDCVLQVARPTRGGGPAKGSGDVTLEWAVLGAEHKS